MVTTDNERSLVDLPRVAIARRLKLAYANDEWAQLVAVTYLMLTALLQNCKPEDGDDLPEAGVRVAGKLAAPIQLRK